MTYALVLLGSLVIAATLLPLLRQEAWWIRVFDFPRAQIAVLGAAILALYLMQARTSGTAEALFIAVLAASVLYQAWRMFPYTPLARRQVLASASRPPASGLSLLIANVYMDNRNAAALLDMIRSVSPDIVLAVEIDQWWDGRLHCLADTHPHAVRYPLENTYGMVLYSRLPLMNPEVRFLVENDVPSIHAGVELPSGALIEFHGLHPKPPAPAESETSTPRDAELLVVAKAVRGSDKPVIVAGDLNDVGWSHTTTLFQRISGLLDPRIGRGAYNTFHARHPFLRFPLDHIFHSTHFRLAELTVMPYFGSDHFPVYIALSYEPRAAVAQPEPQADSEAHREAQEKMEKAGVQ